MHPDRLPPTVAAALTAVLGTGAWWWRRRVATTVPRDRLLDTDEIRRLYDRIAGGYDLALRAYGLLGARRLARRGIGMLGLRPGDTVVDLGCGTGVNLPHLADAVSPGGRVVGVDLSPGMLARARERVRDRTDVMVDLVEDDVAEMDLPADTRGVVSTFALEMVPDYDAVVRRTVDVLSATGGRIAVIGLQRPPRWPAWAVRLGIWLNTPFGVNPAYQEQQPWRSVRRHGREVTHEAALLGVVYLSVGVPA